MAELSDTTVRVILHDSLTVLIELWGSNLLSENPSFWLFWAKWLSWFGSLFFWSDRKEYLSPNKAGLAANFGIWQDIKPMNSVKNRTTSCHVLCWNQSWWTYFLFMGRIFLRNMVKYLEFDNQYLNNGIISL